jgi:IS30 family transposase
MSYKHLTFFQRCRIYGLWKAGYTQKMIAEEIGVNKSTISREFKRNMTFVRTAMDSWQYKPHYAQTYAEERHKYKPKPVKLTEPVKSFVRIKVRT